MPIVKLIKERQLAMNAIEGDIPTHHPQMLLIGCVDARTDPVADLGIPKGQALILRNVAALVHPEHEKRLTESAALAFAVREMKVKHVTVMGHTDCGGIRAAIEGVGSYSLRDYLEPITNIRDKVCAQNGALSEQRHELEEEAVKYSVRSLRSYDYIAEAEEAGRLQLHGWVLDIRNNLIHEWHEKEDCFEPIGMGL